MKLYLLSIVLILMAGSAMSNDFIKDLQQAAQKDVVQPLKEAVQNARNTLTNLLKRIQNLGGKVKRDALRSAPVANSVELLKEYMQELTIVLEKGTEYLLSSGRVPKATIQGVIKFLHHINSFTDTPSNSGKSKISN